MAKKAKIGAILALDGEKEFRQAVTNVNKELTNLKSQSHLVKEQFDGQANTLEALRAKHEVLSKVLETHKKKEEEINEGLRHAQTVYTEYGKKLADLKKDYENAQKKMQQMEAASGSTTDELKAQRQEVERLKKGVEGSEEKYRTAAARIQNWETQLNNAKAQTIKAGRALEENDKYLAEAEKSTDKCAVSIDAYGKKVKEAVSTTLEWKEALKAAVAEKGIDAAADAMKSLGEATVGAAQEMTTSMNQLQASTGTASGAMGDLGKVMDNIYKNNYGDNFTDVADAVSVIVQNLGEMDPSNLEETAESAITLRDTFGFDYQEQIRAVKMLTDTFGISTQKAFNLVAQGAQQGLNKNGDLLDVINEYSVHYKQMGASAEDFFNSLQNGTAAGTFSVDKLGDAYKEFGIRVKDTASSTTEGYQLIGLNADEMRAKFAAGGEAAKAATDTVLSALFQMDDQVKQNQAGVDLFGTMWEDLGIEGVKALTDLNGGISATKDVMSSIKDIKYDDMTNQLTQLTRNLQMKIAEPLAEKYLPKINKGLEAVGDNLDIACTAAIGLGTAISVYKISKSDIFLSMVSAMKKLTTATEGATIAQQALNLAQNASPVGWVLTAIGLLTGGIMAYQMATRDATDETDEFIASMEEQREKTESNIKAQAENIAGTEAEWAANAKLVDKLFELNKDQDKSTGQKELMKGMVEQLSEAIPELAAAYDTETGSINMTREAVESLMETKKEYALAQAYQNSMQEFAQEMADTELAIAKVDDQINTLKDDAKALNYDMDKDKLLNGVDNLSVDWSAIDDIARQISKLEGEKEELNQTLEEAENNFEDAARSAEKYGDDLGELAETETRAAANTVETTAEQAQAYEELRQAISDSVEGSISAFEAFDGGTKITAEEVRNNLQTQIDGVKSWAENMEKLAGAAGKGMTQEFYDYLAEMGPQSANLVQELVNALDGNTPLFQEICQNWTAAMDLEGPTAEKVASFSTALGKQEDYIKLWQQKSQEEAAKAGKEWVKRQSDGMASETETVSEAAKAVEEAAKNPILESYAEFNEMGRNISYGIGDGIKAGKQYVINAMDETLSDMDDAVRKKEEIHSPSVKYRNEIGLNISRGLALGITDGIPEANISAAKLCAAILTTSVKELDIHSPSKVFKDKVGANIAKGVATGISSRTSDATRAFDSLGRSVYKSASSWLAIYKKSHVISLEDERYFWGKTAETVKKGTTAYKTALQKAMNIDAFEKNVRDKVSNCFNVSQYTTNSKGEQEIKAASDYYSEIYSAASKYFDNYSIMHNVSLQQEEYYWQQVLKSLKKGTQAYYDAAKKLKEIKKQQKQEVAETKASNKEYALSGDALSKYKTYYEVSEKAEVQYWDIVRKKFKAGTAERIEADQKYYEAKEQYNSKLEELNQEYYDNCKEVQDKLKEDIQDLTDAYNDAVSERKDSIYSSFGLFDQFESKSASGQTLLYNLKTQVAGYADWEKQLSELGGKNILSEELLAELSAMGPEASASIHALNQLSEAELKEYQGLWEQKNQLAQSRAVKDNEALKEQTEEKIALLKTSARQELDAYKKEYKSAKAEITKTIEAPLKELAKKSTTLGEDAAAKLVAGIKKGATKKSTTAELKKVSTKIKKGLGDLPAAGKTIGDDTLQGIIDGLTNKKKIDASAKDMIDALKKSLQKAADIHSPSRLFKKEIGVQLSAGVAEGIKDESSQVDTAGEDMIKSLLEKSKQQMERQQAALSAYASSIQRTVGITELNNLISVAPVQQVTATVDNSDLAAMLGEIITVMQDGFEKMGNMQLVADTGALIGETSTGMSEAFARNARRLR